jgi:asparagine synthase (glutamine-hydrolysing)
MCGIYGLFNFRRHNHVDRQQVLRSTTSLVHRGPDGGDLYVQENIGLGHRRLSIIDIEGGAQPMTSTDNRYTLVFNGEIYNFLELRADLVAKGHQFRSHSDTEVVLTLFALNGVESFSQLRGMFAIAIWDAVERRLVIARDRIGIKPLYLFESEGSVQFASEVKAIIASGQYKPALNESVVSSYLRIGYVPGPQTMFKDVVKMQPGSYRIYSEGAAPKTGLFWSLPAKKDDQTGGHMSFGEKLQETVRQHMIADVPVGAFLSGGLDSSAIVAVMSKETSEQVNTFCIGYRDSEAENELPYAKAVAEHLKTRHHEFVLEPADFLESIEPFLEHCEEPIGEPQSVAFHKLSMLAKPHVKVMLSGEGADEILGGYGIYSKMQQLQKMSPFARLPVIRSMLGAAARYSGSPKVEIAVEWLLSEPELRYRSVNATQSSAQLGRSISNPTFLDKSALDSKVSQIFRQYSDGSYLRTLNSIDILTWMPDNSLIRCDKMSMAASIEVRVPFLDHEMIEYCLRLPDEQKLRANMNKVALREAIAPLLPEFVLQRRKQGFTVPLSRWFKTSLFSQITDILTETSFIQRGFLNKNEVRTLIERMQQGHADAVDLVFRFLVLALWLKKYCSIAAGATTAHQGATNSVT